MSIKVSPGSRLLSDGGEGQVFPDVHGPPGAQVPAPIKLTALPAPPLPSDNLSLLHPL